VKVFDDKRVDIFWGLRRNESDAEFSRDLGWDDGLGTRAIERAFYTVKREGRRAHSTHQDGGFVIRECDLSARRNLDVLDGVVKIMVESPAANTRFYEGL